MPSQHASSGSSQIVAGEGGIWQTKNPEGAIGTHDPPGQSASDAQSPDAAPELDVLDDALDVPDDPLDVADDPFDDEPPAAPDAPVPPPPAPPAPLSDDAPPPHAGATESGSIMQTMTRRAFDIAGSILERQGDRSRASSLGSLALRRAPSHDEPP